ncbi:hypothetical protein [Gilvibacter sp.]|uniref:hypothetical protein n=1 Tax=Gilvibacter sp. TaxID=2729997 RepID=UPI003B51D61B
MKLEILSKQELDLHEKVLKLEGTLEEKSDKVVYFGISKQYMEIYQSYSELVAENIEAVKRGLFISWYSKVEPIGLTGIGFLQREAEEQIFRNIDQRLGSKNVDFELEWMLDHYSAWNFAFGSISEFSNLKKQLEREIKIVPPSLVEMSEMNGRGQMGLYWKSFE